MKYGTVEELTVYDRDSGTVYDCDSGCGRKTVHVAVEFTVDRKVLFEFMDALRPINQYAPREPIAAILDHSADLGIGEDE